MPRQPTGKPRGRPPGSGHLGEEGTGHKRLTVRLPVELYDALEAVAERAHYTREAPDLARTVRAALEYYLARPQGRQTGNVPHTTIQHNGQTGSIPETLGDTTRQTDRVPVPEPAPTFDAETFYLGELCPEAPERHQYAMSGKSVRYRKDDMCRGCAIAEKQTRQRTKASTTGQAAPAPKVSKRKAKTATV